MIDAHCHLEHMDADDVVSEAKKKGMTAVVTSIADIADKEKIIEMKKKYQDFVYICLGFHPEIMNKYSDSDIEEYIDFIRKNKKKYSSSSYISVRSLDCL